MKVINYVHPSDHIEELASLFIAEGYLVYVDGNVFIVRENKWFSHYTLFVDCLWNEAKCTAETFENFKRVLCKTKLNVQLNPRWRRFTPTSISPPDW